MSGSSNAAAGLFRAITLSLRGGWPLYLGFAALAVPTAISLANGEWTRDYGTHEPIVLAIGAWLFWRQWPHACKLAEPGHWVLTTLLLLTALPTYISGRAYDFATLEAAGLYGIGVALLQARFGVRFIGRLWFPTLFVAFAIPAPHSLLDALTGPLKELVSYLATSCLAVFGMPVARQGVIIFVAQYQLLVEDACSGMNSLVGLTALSLLYAFLTRGPSMVASIMMIGLAIPVAIAANVARVTLLVLITYALGDAAGQSFMHFAAGIVLFSAALILIFVIDEGARRALRLKRRA